MSERWLLVGFTWNEIRSRKYTLLDNVHYVTLDRGDDCPNDKDIDFKGDAFDIATWRRVMSCFGPASFDVIFTDGGIFGIKRDDDIIRMKRALLKSTGHVINYTSPLGTPIHCPFGRPYQYSVIMKKDYEISTMERALQQKSSTSLRDTLRAGLKILI